MDSLIFDLDGTLWDSRETIAASWNEVLRTKKGLDRQLTKEDLTLMMGLQLDEIGRRLFPELTESEQRALLRECAEVENEHIARRGGSLYPGVEETLKQLSEKFPLFIVSNCQDGYIEAFFAYHGLGNYFTDFENPGRTGLSKGENIRLVMERNKLKEPVYVGDTAGDQKAAEFAGLPFIYAEYGFGTVETNGPVISRFSDLLSIAVQ